MSLNVTRLTPASTDGDTILAQVAQYTANESSGITVGLIAFPYRTNT